MSGPATVVTDVPFELAEAKLAAPAVRTGTVAKTDVIGRLSAQRSRLVTVVAPPGYGKTTLLSRWAEADPRPFAWLAVDSRDDDAVVFLRYIAGAIHRVEPVSPGLLGALSGRAGSGWTTRVARVGNALAVRESPLVLVLDDLHAVANPSCLDALAELVQYVPAGSQIAIASREAPALPLARWRADGWVHEVGVPDLRLNEREAALLLEAAGVELDPSHLRDLTEQTEGWPAGLYLAALSMGAGAERRVGVAAFAGDDRFVADYFREELLSRLPPAEARFLKHTSILERMSGPLCDHLLQTTGSARTLETIERKNGFLVPLDRRGEWYRYHHLFGQLLRDELQRSEPDIVPRLSARAMDWCLANDQAEAAVAYAYAAGERDTVAGLIDALGLHVYYDGRIETLDDWVEWFDDAELRRYPAVAVLGAWVRLLTGRVADAERWVGLADGATSAIPLSDGSATIAPWVAILRADMMLDGVERALADADLALETLAPDSGWIPDALMIRGISQALLGADERATADLTAAIEQGLSTGAVDVVIAARAQLALLAAKAGAWSEAAQRAEEAQALVDESGFGDYSASALAHVATARVALHEMRHDDARAALTRAHRLRPLLDHGLPWMTIQFGLELVRAHLTLAEAAAARTVLTETEGVLRLRPHMGLLVDDARALHDRLAATADAAGAWAMSLTGAELRLLPYLATHLTFPEIGSRLFISQNTVKTEAVAIYRKLGASSRSQAVDRAVDVGLLESLVYAPRVNLTRDV